ncbi:DUF1465 family protein [Bartonella tamiae]|uniref:Regulator of CtrA degradation n=1 Tax=Bartonella tamiae Th239 TaxID=1094558 RepID=J0R7N5_9HYPH|nr:DUF1465 family protein [Bartonella tamiae]EJF91744.1 hypothetical protein ME5_00123 [Bartonella tamiae Th239]EJF92588.1 hypothetical protein MEG_01758 [Bartonella tamiae Th307]
MKRQRLRNDNTIVMFEHGAFDHAFGCLYQEGMALIEETAAYIDGNGKIASRALSGEASALYASEAMRMSTRLMQVASWLLLFRAAREDEMTPEQIRQEKAKVSLNTPCLSKDHINWQELPIDFRRLVDLSIRLEERVRHMDQDVENALAENGICHNPVSERINLLKAAFQDD